MDVFILQRYSIEKVIQETNEPGLIGMVNGQIFKKDFLLSAGFAAYSITFSIFMLLEPFNKIWQF